MEWIELGSWILVAVLLAGLELGTRQPRLPQPFGVFAGSIVAAIFGGVLGHLLLSEPLISGHYSFAAFVIALFAAEMSVRATVDSRTRHPPLAGGAAPRRLSHR
jgi:hypothetical protein